MFPEILEIRNTRIPYWMKPLIAKSKLIKQKYLIKFDYFDKIHKNVYKEIETPIELNIDREIYEYYNQNLEKFAIIYDEYKNDDDKSVDKLIEIKLKEYIDKLNN